MQLTTPHVNNAQPEPTRTKKPLQLLANNAQLVFSKVLPPQQLASHLNVV
jgi:hypothetical protein